jgi:hypothetical protein
MVTKEVRALVPIWTASALIVGAAAVWSDARLLAAALAAYGFGAVALGAHCIGHEYAHRTMGLLLSQPCDRRRLFLMKLGALAVMLLTLTAIAWPLVQHAAISRRGVEEPNMLIVAGVSGLLLAPCLTLLARSTLAGIVFSVAIPGTLFVASDAVGVLIYGLTQAAEIDRFTFRFFWRVMFGVWALGAAGAWWMFLRLEAIEGAGAHVQLPRALGGGTRTAIGPAPRRHPIALLLAKELRLQQMTFLVAALFALLWLGGSLLEHAFPDADLFEFKSLTPLYAGIVALLAGALASAEERQFGTLEWQILLPMAAWRQWVVKVGVVMGLGLLLGIGLPFALALVSGSSDLRVGVPRALILLMMVVSLSLYVSSLVTSGVRALVISLPVGWGLAIFVEFSSAVVGAASRAMGGSPGMYSQSGPFIDAAGFVALLLWLGFLNHRSAQRSLRLWKQVVLILAYIVVAQVLSLL